MNCKKCQSPKLIREPFAKAISPNVYELYDKYTCKDCGAIEKVSLEMQDKNNDNTRKILAGTHYVNKKGDLIEKKTEVKKLKDLVEEVQNEIRIGELF